MSKNGMTQDAKPKAGIDNRPWSVIDSTGEDQMVRRCWYEETADALVKSLGKRYEKRKRKAKK